MPLKSFEDSLKNHAEKFSPSVAPANWDAIANALPPEKHKKRAIWLWLSAACISALMAVGIYTNQTSEQPMTNVSKNANASTDNIVTANTNTQVTTETNSSVDQTENAFTTPPSNSIASSKPSSIQLSNTPTKKTSLTYPIQHPGLPTKPLLDLSEFIDKLATDSGSRQAPLVSDESDINDTILMAESIVSEIDSPRLDTALWMTINKAEIKKSLSRHIKHYIGFEASYLYTDTRIKVIEQDVASFVGPTPLNNPNEQLRNQTDRSLPGFQIGLNYSIQRKFNAIKTGLYYKNIRYDMQVYNVNLNSLTSNNRFTSFDYNNSDSFAAGSGGLVKNSFHYLNIPLEIWRETFSLNRWHFNYGGGLNANIFLGNKGVNHQASGFYVKSEKADRSVMNPFHLSATAGLGISYDMGQRRSLFVRALYTRSLAPIESSFVITNYQNLGISAGMKYLLK